MSRDVLSSVTSYPYNPSVGIESGMRNTLNSDGVVCLRSAIDQSWLDRIENGITLALDGASTDLDTVKNKNDSGSFTYSSGAWQSVEPFREFIFDSPMPDIAWALLDSRNLTLFYDFLLIKQAKSNNAATPWHQDHSYYPLDGYKAINCWVALDDIPQQSSLRFIRGSHMPRQLYRAIDFENPQRDYLHARRQLPLPPKNDESDTTNVLSVELKAGDMLAWTSYTLHAAPGNSLNKRRAAFSTNWLGDDIVYNGEPSLESYRDASQVVGQPIACDKFPVIRG